MSTEQAVESHSTGDPGTVGAALWAPPTDALSIAFDWLDRALTSLGPKWQERFAPSLQGLRERHACPDLHIALIGEFSTGKSTLINAIVGAELMAASVLPTTRAVTQIRQGTVPSMTVHFREGEGVSYVSPESVEASVLFRAISQYARTAPSMTGMLESLTADEAVAPLVAAIVVQHPFSALGENLVLYDTPGTNDDEELTRAAESLVETCADAIAVVVRADLPMSMTTLALIERLVERISTSCLLFIVTHLDVVAPEERSKVLQTMRRRLSTVLGGEPAVMHDLSPRAALRRSVGLPLTSEDEAWATSFDDSVEHLRLDVSRRRALLATERLSQLTSALVHEVQLELEQELMGLEEHRERVVQSVISDVESFRLDIARRYHQKAEGKAKAFRRGTKERATTRLREGQAAARSMVDRASSAGQLKQALAGPVTEMMADTATAVEAILSEAAKAHAAGLRTIATEELESFRTRYNELAALAMGSPVPLPSISLAASFSHGAQLASASQLVDAMMHEGSQSKDGGMTVGAVVGTFIAPGIGTVIGAGVGRLVGALFGPPLAAMKQAAATSLTEAYDTFATRDLGEAVARAAAAGEQSAQAAFEATLRELAKAYETVVRRDEQLQHAELKQIDHRRASLAHVRREAGAHIHHLAERRLALLDATSKEVVVHEHA